MWSGGTWVPDRFRMGSWMSGFKTVEEYTNPDFVPPNPVPLKPEPMKVYKNIRSEMRKGRQIFGPYAECHPAGLPYRFSIGYFTVVSTPAEIDFLYADLNYRRIYMDGRPAPDPAKTPPSYYGHSLGHWEGRTLVVETSNIRGKNTQIEPHIPKAEGSRIVERYKPEGPNVMAVHFTMTNPDFTKPWSVDFKILRDPKRVLVEDICSDGNRYILEEGGELTMHSAEGKPLERAED
ncbi:hypothetical protein [Sphingomonas bacterium]|uniref:hypothetical protein n=1 Tax=Sphingomonas bacterium TaxID=1895847 RepID=UPI001575C245|nr:hypothetical protein [Sphingomonas bacterium]